MKTIIRWMNSVSTRTVLYLFIASSLVCVFGLRHNNQQMIKLREAVYQADKNNTDINKALNNLRSYVYAHMNTNLSSGNNNIKPPIQLKYTYQRLYDNQFDAVQQANQKIYTDAQTYCQSVNNAFFGTTRVPCVQNYVVNHGVKQANITIPPGLYEFDFVSPRWSPDLAGWSLLVSLVSFILLLLKLGSSKIRVQK